MTGEIYNVYCDESCHLEFDRMPVMVLGAVWCRQQDSVEVSRALRKIKRDHGFASDFETKWTKVSPAKLAFYEEVLQFFFSDDRLRFRGLLVSDKAKLDHATFDQTHDDWYYKMYYLLLGFIFSPEARYRIYIDIKDTRGGPKVAKLHSVLCNSLHDFDRQSIERVQQIRSHESEILQLADLLIGAIGYANRGLPSESAKGRLVELIREQPVVRALDRTSPFTATKFNLFVWDAQESE